MRTTLLCLLFAAVATAAAPGPFWHDPDGRLAALDAQIRREPLRAELYLERAAVLLDQRDLERALRDCDRAAALQPALAAAAMGRAQVLFALGRDQDALLAVDAAAALGRRDVDVDLLRGRVLAALGRTGDAAVALQAVLDRQPRPQPEHFLELAALLGDGGSGPVLDRGLRELGPVPGLVTAAVDRDLRRGDFDTALLRVEQLQRHATRQAPWWRLRAGILDRAGRADEAAEARQRAVLGDAALRRADALLAATPGPAPAAVRTPSAVIDAGSEWHFCDRGAVDAGWSASGFDDGDWQIGRGQIGYGDGDEGAIAGFGSDPHQRAMTTWFRREFTVPAGPTFRWAELRLLRDDGAAVHLDGREVVRSNLPAGPLLPSTAALQDVDGADETAWQSFRLDPALLSPGRHTLAVEVHQHDARSSDLSFDCQLLLGQATTLVTRGPYLQNGTPDGAVLRWRTSVPSATQLWIGPQPNALGLVFNDPTPRTEHTAPVTGLLAETRYYYGVGDATGVLAGADQGHSFTTLPPAAAVRPLRAWALGDCGTANAVQTAVRDAYRAFAATAPADLVLFLGDNAYSSGTDAQYQSAIFDMYQAELANTFSWSTLGNHDALSASGLTQTGVYFDVFDLPTAGQAGGLPSGTEAYYSFDRGHVHFVCLDSQDSSRAAGGPMLTWLQADLASTAAPWLVAFFHHPPYTKGTHDSDNTGDSGARMYDMRRNALPILEAHGVDLVLSGHSHTYERSYLLDGHYGFSAQIVAANYLDRGDGRDGGDGAYGKAAAGRGVHDGAVYVTTGSAGQSGSGSLNHPAMLVSLPTAGSLVFDIDGDRLDATFVTATGAVADTFTIEKNATPLLRRDVPALSLATGGTQAFALDAGPAHAGQLYILGGALGTAPGIQLGAVHVPLNPDGWFSTWLGLVNSPVYPGSLGVLDGSGRANAAFVLPPAALPPSAAGLSVWHAYAVFDASGPLAASNAVRLRLEP